MPRYKWSIEFDADDDADANLQIEDAKAAFHSTHSDELEQQDEN